MTYNTIILSDIHLGSKASMTENVLAFLDNHDASTYILNGDIIDGWALKRGGKWLNTQSKFMRKIFKLGEKGKKIIWLRGNHDDFLKDFEGLFFGNISVVEDYIHEALDGRRMYVFHGDVLDVFIMKAAWIAHLGSIGYDFILWLNRNYNQWRKFRGLPYYSISRDIKNGIKRAANFINSFEYNAVQLAHGKNCEVAICGHIHHPTITENYMNSGDWCENCSALVENLDGTWEIKYFTI